MDKKLLVAARDADLAASGLDEPAIIRKLGLGTVHDVEQTAEITGITKQNAVSYRIPYYGIDGKQIRYERYKIIPLTDDYPFKYFQEPKTIPRIYFPPLIKWRKIVDDPRERILITEGEKKAACATKLGLPCIGLGGVWNFRSQKWGMSNLPELDDINFSGRRVEICYDSDMYENEMVRRAQYALSVELLNRGAEVYVRRLESREGKVGLDDFLVEFGVEAFEELECYEADVSKELNELDSDIIYIKDIVSFYSRKDDIMYGTVDKLMTAYANKKYTDEKGNRHSIARTWLEWPHRSQVKRITYAPGHDAIFNDQLNVWRPPPIEPQKGDVDIFLKMLSVLNNARFQRWVMQWLAYPLQNPQNPKLYQALVLWSLQGGTGKTFIGHLMKEIYGHNYGEIGNFEFHDNRRAWMRNKQFILCEEITNANYRTDAGLIKHMITAPTIYVNEKYIPAYEIPNYCNFMITSNREDPVPLDKGDRRMAVGEMKMRLPDAFWRDADRWAKSGKAGPAIYWFLLNKVDCSDFNPKGDAILTEEKEAMLYAGMSGLEQWVEDLIHSTDAVFKDMAAQLRGKDVFTCDELSLFLPDKLSNTSTAAIGKALTRGGCIRAGVIKVGETSKRLVAVRNLNFWSKNRDNPTLWAANYNRKMTVADVAKKKMRPKRRR